MTQTIPDKMYILMHGHILKPVNKRDFIELFKEQMMFDKNLMNTKITEMSPNGNSMKTEYSLPYWRTEEDGLTFVLRTHILSKLVI